MKIPEIKIDWKNFLLNTVKLMILYGLGSLAVYNLPIFEGKEFLMGWFAYSVYVSFLKKEVAG